MNIILQGFTILLYQFYCCNGAPFSSLDEELKFAQDYLQRYGYSSKSAFNGQNFSNDLKKFKASVGLEITGELDAATLELMRRPRCGILEFKTVTTKTLNRNRRFVPHSPKWRQTTLTWKLVDPYQLLSNADHFVMRNVLHRAFDVWSVASQRALRFYELRRDKRSRFADINVFFARGQHNDSLPFDGKNGVVAHGFYPTDGNLHFDADEDWALDIPGGINVFQTAVHEIGHLLGLEHSQDYKAVMFPINRPYDPNYSLTDDDIRGIRYLYSPEIWTYYLRRYYKDFMGSEL